MAKNILVVEDNDHLRQILASFIRFSGYDVLEAESGSEAIEKAALAKPDLILLDLTLPDLNGIDVARAIKKNVVTADIPIIACSAYASGEEMEEALRAGIVDYLEKPIAAALIKAKIEEFILP
jgi:two-component system, cell cycle response regulator DivK